MKNNLLQRNLLSREGSDAPCVFASKSTVAKMYVHQTECLYRSITAHTQVDSWQMEWFHWHSRGCNSLFFIPYYLTGSTASIDLRMLSTRNIRPLYTPHAVFLPGMSRTPHASSSPTRQMILSYCLTGRKAVITWFLVAQPVTFLMWSWALHVRTVGFCVYLATVIVSQYFFVAHVAT